MCGIVGYVGKKDAKKVIVEGLRKLEYRGYDSSGIALVKEGQCKVWRAEGKLKALEKKLSTGTPVGSLGIGHTRWATHGAPVEKNAHPHRFEKITIVHNGIIENYGDLKKELIEQGHSFESDTDTEVIAHLISNEYVITKDLLKAVHRVVPKLRGAFSVLVICDDLPDTIVAFKYGPPLIVGCGEKENFVASDALAVLQHTQSVKYLEDFDVALVHPEQVKIFDQSGTLKPRSTVQLDKAAEVSDKKGFKHFMLKEIFEQPRAVAAAIAPYVELNNHLVSMASALESSCKNGGQTLEQLAKVERIYIVACGTSYFAGLYAEYLIENVAKIPVEVEFASEFRYRSPVLLKNSLALVISQSGETADTLAALRSAKDAGLLTAGLCNTKNSTIDREVDIRLYMNSGIEVGVASTKAFVSSLTVLNIFALQMAKFRDEISQNDEIQVVKGLLELPSQMETVLAYDRFFREASKSLKKYKGFLYLGRGHSFPIAMEGALKLKELAYMHAEGYAAGEMKHGPLALIDEAMVIVVICPKDKYYEKTISNLEEAKARGGKIISIGCENDDTLKGLSEHFLPIPNVVWQASGILSVLPVQLLSYHLANVLGHDVDQPRNLAKSVTVE